MKSFVCSLTAGFSLSITALSLITLAGCSNSASGVSVVSPAPVLSAKNAYALENNFGNNNVVQSSVVAYATSSTGAATPASTLTLPSGFVGGSIAVGPQGQIYVAGQNSSTPSYGTILEYAAGATGTATPTVTLNGSAAGTTTFVNTYNIAVNSAGTLVVPSSDGTIETFASGFTATSAPTQYLTWGRTSITNASYPVAIDTAGDIFLANTGNGAGVATVFEVFAAGATGAAAPTRTITGTNTTSLYYYGPPQIVVDGAGDLFVAHYNPADDPSTIGTIPTVVNNEPTGIIEFAAGATGNATPAKRISGALTKIVEPDGLTIDVEGNLYYVDANNDFSGTGNIPQLLETFSSTATGNVAPTSSITTTGYTYDNGENGIAAF
jgi:hypothetical protein